MIYDVAISYAKEEAGRLREVEEALVREGLAVWTDRGLLRLGEEGEGEWLVPAGVEHWEAISDGIRRSATFVYLDSAAWRASAYCRKEQAFAQEQGIRVIAATGMKSLSAAVEKGLEVSRAHARVRAAREQREVSPEDVTVLSEANLGDLGMSIPPAMGIQMDEATKRDRRRRRRLRTLATGAVAVAAVLAVTALVAWIAARQDEARATDAARHVESLALAIRSENATNSFARLAIARRAIELEQNQDTVAALREAVEDAEKGVTLRLVENEPLAIDVADSGDVAVVQGSGAVSLVSGGDDKQREVSAAAADAAPLIAITPRASRVGVITREAEGRLIDFESGHVVAIRRTHDLASILFLSEDRGIAITHGGEVLEFDPRDRHPRARRLEYVAGSVRAATVASRGPAGSFSLAILSDGAVEVAAVGRSQAPWRVELPHRQTPFILGWEGLRVCGDRLAVLGAAAAEGIGRFGFGIPYTISPDGKLIETGSVIHSAGSICLPEGTAIAADINQGQYPFPASGPTLPNLVGDPGARIAYAIDSSENGQWAAAAGSDGLLKIVQLEAYGRTRTVPAVEAVAPVAEGDPLVVADGSISSVSPSGALIETVAATGRGEAARGAYLDPRLGSVLAIGEEVFVVNGRQVHESVSLGEPVAVIHVGRSGASALAFLPDSNQAVEVPLDGGPVTGVELPSLGASVQLSDLAELPGRSRRLAIASTDGYVRLLAFGSGKVLRRQRVTAPGPISLGLERHGRLVAAGTDGVVRILDSETLATAASRRVASAGPRLLTSDASGELAAVFGGEGEAVVLGLPSLDVATRVPPIYALNSLGFNGDGSLALGADVHLIGGGHEASITSWPLCEACLQSPAQLRATAAALVEPAPSGQRPVFRPGGGDREATEEAQGALVSPGGIGGIRLGMTVTDLRERQLIGPLRPGCELVSGQRVAELLPPLEGTAVFADGGKRLSSIMIEGQAATERGVGLGTSAAAALEAYPDAEYAPPRPHAPIPVGFLRIGGGEEPQITLLIDAKTHRISLIGVPEVSFCE